MTEVVELSYKSVKFYKSLWRNIHEDSVQSSPWEPQIRQQGQDRNRIYIPPFYKNSSVSSV